MEFQCNATIWPTVTATVGGTSRGRVPIAESDTFGDKTTEGFTKKEAGAKIGEVKKAAVEAGIEQFGQAPTAPIN